MTNPFQTTQNNFDPVNEEIKSNIYHKSPTMKMIQMILKNDQQKSRSRKMNRNFLSQKNNQKYPQRQVSFKLIPGRSNSQDTFADYENTSSTLNSKKTNKISCTNTVQIYQPTFSIIAQDYIHRRLFYLNQCKTELEIISKRNPSQRALRFSSRTHIYDGKSKVPSIVNASSVSCHINKRDKQVSESFRWSRLRDDSSEKHWLSLKIKKDDLEEIITYLLLGYTYQLIEQSSSVLDRDFSGSYIPMVYGRETIYYVGGYGCIDGVTECPKINKAAEKFKNIEFNNVEAIEALSHMYGMNQLLAGVENRNLFRSSKMMSVRLISSESMTDNDSDEFHDSRT